MIEFLKTNEIILILVIALIIVIYYVSKQQKSKLEKRKIISFLKGINYIIEDKTDKAIEELTSTIELEPDIVDVYISIGNLFRKKGEVNRSLIIHKGLLARKLDNEKKLDVYINIGIDYKKAGLYDRAKETFKNALSLDPKNKEIRKYLEEVYEDSRDWESALTWQKRFGENKKITAHIYCELGKGALKENKQDSLKKAREYFTQALQEDKNCFDALLHLGIIESDETKSFSFWLKAVEIKSEFSNLILENIKDPNLAYSFIKRALVYNAHNLFILYYSTVFLLKIGKTKKALSLIQIMLKDNKVSKPVNILAIQCLSKQLKNKQLEELAFRLNNNVKYTCKSCGYSTYNFFWKCPKCRVWDSMKVDI